MGPLGGGSHVSTAGGLLAVILRFDGEFAAPLSTMTKIMLCNDLQANDCYLLLRLLILRSGEPKVARHLNTTVMVRQWNINNCGS